MLQKPEVIPSQETYLVATNPDLDHSHHDQLHILFAGESQTKTIHIQGPKLYDFYLLHFILKGKGTYETERGCYQLEQGDIFLIRPQELITYQSDPKEPWHYVWVAFKGNHVEPLLQSVTFINAIDVVSVYEIEDAVMYCRSIYNAFKDKLFGSSLRASGLFYLLLSSLQLKEQPIEHSSLNIEKEHPIAKQMIQYLTTQFANPLSIEVMAETLGYNRAYLSRIFKQYTQLSPRTYLLHYRLDRARHLLRARHDLTIEQVAASVGIQDALYFSKQFKRYTSQSPTQYRLNLKQRL